VTLPATYYFVTYSTELDLIGMLASVDEYEKKDFKFTSFGDYDPKADEWGCDDFEDIRATAMVFRSPHTFVIGDRGEVLTRIGDDDFTDRLPDSGVDGPRHLGRPKKIRMIAGRPYVCGFAGQFYTIAGKLESRKWVHMDDGLAEPEGKLGSIDLTDLDGTAANDIYTVGIKGLLAHWDGARWTRIKLLTNSNLFGIRCITKSHVVAVGNKGVFIEFDGKDWRVEQVPGAEKLDFFDVQHFQNQIFVCAGTEMFVRKGDKWQRVAHGLDKKKTDFYRFTVGAERLWVIGKKRLNSFNGKKWVAHIDPDNG
jgi:hypothetical protein